MPILNTSPRSPLKGLKTVAGLPDSLDITVPLVSIQVLAPEPRRYCVMISNFGAADAWLAWDEDAEIEKGIWLPKGTSRELTATFITKGPLNAITPAVDGIARLAWQEILSESLIGAATQA